MFVIECDEGKFVSDFDENRASVRYTTMDVCKMRFYLEGTAENWIQHHIAKDLGFAQNNPRTAKLVLATIHRSETAKAFKNPGKRVI